MKISLLILTLLSVLMLSFNNELPPSKENSASTQKIVVATSLKVKPNSLTPKEVADLSSSYINFAETSFTKNRAVRKITLPVSELQTLLSNGGKQWQTIQLIPGRNIDRQMTMVIALSDGTTTNYHEIYEVFSEAAVGKLGDQSGKALCPPPICDIEL